MDNFNKNKGQQQPGQQRPTQNNPQGGGRTGGGTTNTPGGRPNQPQKKEDEKGKTSW